MKGRVQRQLVETMVGSSFLEVVELHFQAITLKAVFTHERARIVPLHTYACPFETLSIDNKIAIGIRFFACQANKAIPICHLDVDGMHA